MEQNLRYFSILPEVVVGTKNGNHLSDVLVRLGRQRDEVVYFFFGVLSPHASYINNVSLNDANIEILFSAKSFEISALFLFLLLLLSYPTITRKFDEKRMRVSKTGTNSSAATTFQTTASSVYSLRQAGQRPLRF